MLTLGRLANWQLSQWVAAEILRGENRTARLARLEKFIDIMDCCVKLNNFQSAMSILAAFNSTPIYRLQSLWDNISEPHREIVTRVRETMSAEKNMSNYRSVFKSLASPKIPFLGTYDGTAFHGTFYATNTD